MPGRAPSGPARGNIRCAAAGARLHDLRHFAATQMIGAGYDLRTVAGRLGHRQPWTTLNTYAAFLPGRDHAAADHLASLLGDR